MTTLKKGDFTEIDYTGRLTGNNAVFDTTAEEIAKREGIANPRMVYEPIVICIGEGHLLRGLDAHLEGKETGKEYTIILPSEQAFGKKSAKLVQLIPITKFKSQGITPQQGLAVNVDGKYGEIRRATGGRVLVDFNHPLAGKDVTYMVTIRRKVDDPAEQVKAVLAIKLNMHDIDVDVAGGKAMVSGEKLGGLPRDFADLLCAQLRRIIPSLETMEFVDKKTAAPKDSKKAEKRQEEIGKEMTRAMNNHENNHE